MWTGIPDVWMSRYWLSRFCLSRFLNVQILSGHRIVIINPPASTYFQRQTSKQASKSVWLAQRTATRAERWYSLCFHRTSLVFVSRTQGEGSCYTSRNQVPTRTFQPKMAAPADLPQSGQSARVRRASDSSWVNHYHQWKVEVDTTCAHGCLYRLLPQNASQSDVTSNVIQSRGHGNLYDVITDYVTVTTYRTEHKNKPHIDRHGNKRSPLPDYDVTI